MGNIKNIYFDWNKAGSCQVRQYDHLSNRVIFGNAPKFENYYLLVAMKESESDEQAKEMSPIKLTSPIWLIPNSYTQMAQQITFQICNQDADGTFEQHSAEYTINVVKSHEHEGKDIDVDPSPMYDAYKEYVDDRIEELIDEAGGISVDTREYVDEKIQTMIAAAGDIAIDTTLSVSGAAADAKATGDAISDTNERLDDVESDVSALEDSLITNETLDEIGLWFLHRIDFNSGLAVTASSGKYAMTRSMPQNDAHGTTVVAKSPYQIRVAYYSTSTIGDGSGYTGNSGEYTSEPISVPANVPYYHIVVYNSAGALDQTLTSSDFFTQTVQKNILDELSEKVDILDDAVMKKTYQSGNIFFSVDVNTPLAYGDESVSGNVSSVECVLRLPSTYTPSGAPTRLVLACHGASGYIDSANDIWYNSDWITFMTALTDAGYAVFDANVLPASVGSGTMGYAVGSPLYIAVLKKAYDYIVNNYNVYKERFAHGTSMGGPGAKHFAHVYPKLVLAVSSFAGRDVLRYLNTLKEGTGDDLEKFAAAYEYASYSALMADEFSHGAGVSPSLSLVKYVNGTAQMPPYRGDDFSAWLTYYTQFADLGKTDNAGDWIGINDVPYKSWNSWADNAAYTKIEETLQKAYARSGAVYEAVIWDSGSHNELSYGKINNMRGQLIAWYRRWE